MQHPLGSRHRLPSNRRRPQFSVNERFDSIGRVVNLVYTSAGVTSLGQPGGKPTPDISGGARQKRRHLLQIESTVCTDPANAQLLSPSW